MPCSLFVQGLPRGSVPAPLHDMSQTHMTAAFIRSHGGNEVVQVGLRPIPKVGHRQVLIAVHKACVNPRDWLLRDGRYVFRHVVFGDVKILGSDVSGVVVEVGRDVRRFRAGDEVYGMQTLLGQMGGYAQRISIDASAVALKPSSMSHAEAAGVPVAGLTALQGLRDDGRVRRGDSVLIVGASGGVGSYAVQLAKYFGAHVIGVSSKKNHGLLYALGADGVIDYQTEDVVANAVNVDLVFDAIGRGSLGKYRGCLRAGGRYITTVPTLTNSVDFVRSHAQMLLPGGFCRRSRTILVRSSGADLEVLGRIANQGAFKTVIDSTYALKNVTDALARSRSQRTCGKIIVSMPARLG